LRMLRQVYGGAFNPVPLLPRGRSAGAIVSPRGTERAGTDSSRPSLYAPRRRDSLFCRRVRQSHSGPFASGRPSTDNAIPHPAAFPRRPGGGILLPLSPLQLLVCLPPVACGPALFPTAGTER